MKLFYSPGACSMGIHVILEEIGKPYEAELLALAQGAQNKPEFTAVNAKGKVPTLLRDDGTVLTEFPAIAWYLGRSNPDAKLIPEGIEAEARALEMMDYVVSSVHMLGFTRIFKPVAFFADEAGHDQVRDTGKTAVAKGFGLLNAAMEDKEYVAGTYSVADAALFYVEYWSAKRMQVPLPANLDAHLTRMLARPAVQRALAAEGLAT